MDRIALDSLQMQLRNVPYLKKRDIYLFGVNNQARETIKILVKWGAKVCGILDNDSNFAHRKHPVCLDKSA